MRLPPLPVLLPRLAIAFCFLSFGIWELVHPTLWTVYVPPFLNAVARPTSLVFLHGVVLTVTALGVLFGYAARFWTSVAVLIMLELCIMIGWEEGFSDVFIRDVAILLFTAGLWSGTWNRHNV